MDDARFAIGTIGVLQRARLTARWLQSVPEWSPRNATAMACKQCAIARTNKPNQKTVQNLLDRDATRAGILSRAPNTTCEQAHNNR